MTNEQLDEIEKLAERTIKLRGEGADPPAERTLALVKAVREARAEVEQLREMVQQVHGLVSKVRIRSTALMEDVETLREIHKITKDNQ